MEEKMRTVLLFLVSLLAGISSSQAGERVGTLLVLALDISRSVGQADWHAQTEGTAQAFLDPLVVDAIGVEGLGVGVIAWSGSRYQEVLIEWRRLQSRASIEAFAADLRALPHEVNFHHTAVGHALVKSIEIIKNAPFPADRRVIDISGDGVDNTDLGVLQSARNAALANGIVINGLSIGSHDDPVHSFYQASVIAGPDSFTERVFNPHDLQAFTMAMWQKLLKELGAFAQLTLD